MSEPPRHLDYWQPPPGVGDPVACLATSFTFDSEFFESQCLARFFGLDSPRGDKGGPDLAYLLQTEEKLAEAQVGVIVDRSVRVGKRSLRWDVIPVGVRGGLQHSKVSVLLWQRLARFMISSANLTPAGYRNQIEAVVVFDAHPTSSVPEPLLLELVGALRRVLSRAAATLGSAGPVVRAGVILDQAERHISQCGLPEAISRGRMLASIATSGSGSTVLDAIQHVWVGGPPRRATVLSPFWDESGPKGAAVTALIQKLALRGPVAATFLAAVDPLNGTYRVPPSLRNLSTARLRAEIRAFATPDDRRLHAKVVVLESDTWTAGLVGSSNFTESGLGLSAHPHLEINLALGGPADSNIAVALRALVPVGELVPDGATFAEGEDEDERPEATLPWGFIECLLEPGERSILHLRLDPHDLPPSWSVSVPGGRVVLSSDEWRRDGSPADWAVSLESSNVIVWLDVKWRDAAGDRSATWIVNVTDMARLPPPTELRDLPVHLLVRALASSRPMYFTLAEGRSSLTNSQDGVLAVVDPLKRFDDPGSLLRRVRDFSSAMAGLKRRLERPVAGVQALEWRLRGPVGPLALGQGLAREAADELISGESAFLLAELVLTLSRVRWKKTLEETKDTSQARAIISGTIADVKALQMPAIRDRRLRTYVKEAMQVGI